MGNFTISEDLKEAFKQRNIEYFEIREASPEEFYDAIGRAKISNVHGAFVTQHSIEDYSQMQHLFLTTDGSSGVAITPDGNIVSIFNGGEKRGVLKTLLPLAIEHGGRKLDNYNSEKLSAMYELYGFNPVSKVKFNLKFAPDDWNFERDGMPDIVFWIHNGDAAKDVIVNFGRYLVSWETVELFETYEQAGEYRDELIEKIDAEDEDVVPICYRDEDA